MSIKSPRTDPSHRGYQAECQSALELALGEIIEGAVQAGWSSTAVYDAVQMFVIKQRLAYSFDPDPADDPSP